MSLFSYKIRIEGGSEQTGQLTARTEQQVREKVEKKHRVAQWLALEEKPNPPGNGTDKPAAPPPPPQPKRRPPAAPDGGPKREPLTKLGKMLYRQQGRCFFCGQPLREEEASIEHLLAKSRGGTSTEDNEVVCHATLNDAFGDIGLKEKFSFVLKAAGAFKCPGA